MSTPTVISTRPAVDHPSWCSLDHCDAVAGHADIRHSTTPVSWQAGQADAVITMAVQRDDEIVGGNQQVRGYGIALRLHHHGIVNPDGSPQAVEVWLSPQDMGRIEDLFVRYFELVGRGLASR